MKTLAIETSCDETAIAILECEGDEKSARFRVLGNALLSQIELHRPYGGVFPTLAKREHLKNLPVMFDEAMREADNHTIDAIAVTAGPGLEPALWTGIEYAKAKSLEFGVPLVAVNHMEGHILAGLVRESGGDSSRRRGVSSALEIADVRMPLLALLISGGHTELVLMREWLKYELVGQTRDDAVGEAFDKVARMLELPYPGGPEISKLAEESREQVGRGEARLPDLGLAEAQPDLRLPRPMINEQSCDFSFAGLKTAVLYFLKDRPELNAEEKKHLAREFEDAVADVLWKKTARALDETGAKTLVIGGGVSANTHIRRVFKENIVSAFPDTSLQIPASSLTTDNAIMIALAGFYRALRHEFVQPLDKLEASGNLSLAHKP